MSIEFFFHFLHIFSGDPYENRTRVSSVKGMRPKPLDERARDLVPTLAFKPAQDFYAG